MPGVPILGQPLLGLDFQSFEVVPQNEVDHTAHGIRAIDRGGAAGQHLHTLHQGLRDGTDVHRRRALQTADVAPAVNQNQGAVLSQSPQVQSVGAMPACPVDRLFRGNGRQQRGDVVDRIREGEVAGHSNVVGLHGLHRRGADQVGMPGDPRTHYDQLFEFVGVDLRLQFLSTNFVKGQ